jgi:hypothetical protein
MLLVKLESSWSSSKLASVTLEALYSSLLCQAPLIFATYFNHGLDGILILFSFGRTVVAKLCLFSLVLHLQLCSCFRSFEYFHSSVGIGLHHQLCLCFRLSEHFHFTVGIGLHHQLCLCFRSSEYFHFSVGYSF